MQKNNIVEGQQLNLYMENLEKAEKHINTVESEIERLVK